MDEVDDADLVVERVAALDLGKAGLEACVRVPHPQRPGRRMQELRGYATTTAQLLAMAAWLRHWHVQRVVMESTSTYWKGVYYLLEAEGFDCWLVNAREVKNGHCQVNWWAYRLRVVRRFWWKTLSQFTFRRRSWSPR